jgi:hypothetical protein
MQHAGLTQSVLRRTFSLMAPLCAVLLAACSGSATRLELEGSFPIPLIAKSPVNMGIHLDEALTTYTHTETIENKGSWEVFLGPAQKELFGNLAIGLFQDYAFVDGLSVEPPLDGVLQPAISEVQFALPSQTRSDYYEVWIRYDFYLYDRAGNPVGQWKLPAYGKASKSNYGSKTNGLQAAAMAACRDAMAFFSINFAREPAVQKWIAAGKPLMPPPPGTTPATASDPHQAPNAPAGDADAATSQGSPT